MDTRSISPVPIDRTDNDDELFLFCRVLAILLKVFRLREREELRYQNGMGVVEMTVSPLGTTASVTMREKNG